MSNMQAVKSFNSNTYSFDQKHKVYVLAYIEVVLLTVYYIRSHSLTFSLS